jgi:hypothetical protein
VDTFSLNGYLLTMGPLGGGVNTLVSLPSPGFGDCMAVAGNNTDVLGGLSQDVAAPIPPSPIVSVTPAGAVTTLAVAPAATRGLAPDQDGTYLAAVTDGASLGLLQRLDPALGSLTTLISFGTPLPSGVGLDGDNGDYLVTRSDAPPGGSLLRVDRATLAVSTIATGLGRLTSVAFEPATGTFVVTRLDAPGCLRVTRTGVVSTIRLAPYDAVVVDEIYGSLVLAGGSLVEQVRPSGSVLISQSLPGLDLKAAEIPGRRRVSGSGPFTAGQTYTVQFSFPHLPGAFYLAMMSLALRPGIALPGGLVLNLAPDALLLASIGGIPGITTGFAGALDGSGRATGSITLPPGFPPGIRIFVSAVASQTFPTNLDPANPIGLTSN